jgi:hypothetical protein
MTPLAKAHEVLNGDLNNSYRYDIGESTLYWDNRDQTYTTYYGMMSRASLTYISTVEEFNNFKGDDVKTVYTQEMAYNGVLPSVGMELLFFKDSKMTKNKWTRGTFAGKAYSPGGCAVFLFTDHETKSTHIVDLDIQFKPLTPPVELIEGKAYQFDIGKKTRLGFFKGSGFLGGIRSYWALSACTNIKPLTVKGK